MPDVGGQQVLIVGDSLSASAASPGGQLAARLRKAGADVILNAKVSRSAHSFVREPDYANQIAAGLAQHPDLVIVVLGTNDIGLGLAQDRVDMTQVKLALARDGAAVWAFGPPSFAPGVRDGGVGVVAMMRGVFGSLFLDLRPLTADLTTQGYRAGDQIHFTTLGGSIAGARMADRFTKATSIGPGLALALLTALVAGYVWLR